MKGTLPLGHRKNDKKKGILFIMISVGILVGVMTMATISIYAGKSVWISGYGLAGLTTPFLFYGLKKFGILGGQEYTEYENANMDNYVDEEGRFDKYNMTDAQTVSKVMKTCTSCTNGRIYLDSSESLYNSMLCTRCHGRGFYEIQLGTKK